MKTNKEKMLNGELFLSSDIELINDFRNNKSMLEEFNQTSFRDGKRRGFILKELFKSTGKYIHIEPPFYCDYGKNITIGENFYANYGCTLLDSNNINFGDNVILGSRVVINTLTYPTNIEDRRKRLALAKAVNIGNDVFIGNNVTISSGVNICDNVYITDGSVVLNSIEKPGVYSGNPAFKVDNIEE